MISSHPYFQRLLASLYGVWQLPSLIQRRKRNSTLSTSPMVNGTMCFYFSKFLMCILFFILVRQPLSNSEFDSESRCCSASIFVRSWSLPTFSITRSGSPSQCLDELFKKNPKFRDFVGPLKAGIEKIEEYYNKTSNSNAFNFSMCQS
jgi:hypothetical protein